MLSETVNQVEAIQRRSRVSAVWPLGFLDSQKFRSQPKKKRMNNPSQDKDKLEDNTCQIDEADKHIDCKA